MALTHRDCHHYWHRSPADDRDVPRFALTPHIAYVSACSTDGNRVSIFHDNGRLRKTVLNDASHRRPLSSASDDGENFTGRRQRSRHRECEILSHFPWVRCSLAFRRSSLFAGLDSPLCFKRCRLPRSTTRTGSGSCHIIQNCRNNFPW